MITIVQFVHWYLTIYSIITTYLYSINSFTIDAKVLRKISKYVFRFAFFFFSFLPYPFVSVFVVRKDRSVEKSSGLRILRGKYEPCGDLLDRTVFYR